MILQGERTMNSNHTATSKEQEIKALENKIYDAYYKQNSGGDARFGLWPEVIKAKKEKDPITALNEILDQYQD